MARNTIDNHKLVKKPKRPERPRSPKHDVKDPSKSLPRPLRHKARGK